MHRNHNVSVLIYHIIFSAKYRGTIFTEEVDRALKLICIEMEMRHEIEFLEIGADKDHVHFFVQLAPTYSPIKIARTIKSTTAREIFKRIPSVKKQLWSDEYYVSTVGKHAYETKIKNYVKNQENEYIILHK